MSLETERRLPPVFPSKRTLFSGRRLCVADLVTMDTLVGDQSPVASYLAAEGEKDALYLLFRKGKAYTAGHYRDGRLAPLGVREFFSRLLRPDVGERTFDLFEVDPAVLLLIAVHFQKRPALSVSTDLASAEEILGKVEEAGRDAVIAVIDGALRHVVFCQGGRPARFHAAGDVVVPEEKTIGEVVTVFCFERGGGAQPLTLEVYDDLEVRPAADHGLELARYASSGGSTPRFQLELRQGKRHLETRVFQADQCVIGRSRDCDLRLDDNAVSREHAAVEWSRGDLVLRDLGSDNGTQINDRPLESPHRLEAGDEIRVGRTTLVYMPLPRARRSATEETVHLEPEATGPRVLHLGQNIFLPDGGLILGAGTDADIRVKGLMVRDRQAHLFVAEDGRAYLEHLGGWRRPRVNDRPVTRCALSSGDSISLAGEELRFYDAE